MSTVDRVFGRGMVVVLALLLGTATACSGGFIFTAQDRSVTGQLGGALGQVGPQTITAPPPPNFGVFDATVTLTHPTYGGGAYAHQRSELLPGAITVTGQTSASRPAMVGTGWASASSSTSVSFDLVDAATDVTLSASGTSFNNLSIPVHKIQLIGPGSITIVHWNSAFGDATQFPAVSGSRSTSLTLGAGSYQLLVGMSGYNDAHQSHGVSNFDVALAIPEPGGVMAVGVFLLVGGLSTRRRGR